MVGVFYFCFLAINEKMRFRSERIDFFGKLTPEFFREFAKSGRAAPVNDYSYLRLCQLSQALTPLSMISIGYT